MASFQDMKFEPKQTVDQSRKFSARQKVNVDSESVRIPQRAPVKVQQPTLEAKPTHTPVNLNPGHKIKETAKVTKWICALSTVFEV